MLPILKIDVAIIGGGIAGLWLLALLRERGYGALLIENAELGGAQTLCAQGIIHGGTKYRLPGTAHTTADAVAAMPALWRACHHGRGAIDLRAAQLLSAHQYLWATTAPTSRIAAFCASQLLQNAGAKISEQQPFPDDYPAPFRHAAFRGTVYQLDEPVFAVASIVETLSQRYQHAIVHNPGALQLVDGQVLLQHPDARQLRIQPSITVFSAGAGNAQLPWVQVQQRPLHMVMARGAQLPGALYAHCIGAQSVPRLTITSHYATNGQLIWYLGGGLAEQGVERERAAQIATARQELTALFPWVNWQAIEFATFTVQRAEAQQAHGQRPDGVSVLRNAQALAIFPTKLALAPLLAEQVLDILHNLQITPQFVDLSPCSTWSRPKIGVYPWDREDMQWS